jgi:hypothetical protein
MAAYGYWAQAKGWTDSRWIGVMRQDNAIAYAVTGAFVLSMLVVGAELLHGRGVSLTTAIVASSIYPKFSATGSAEASP